MRSKKRTIGILIVVIVVLLGFAGSLLAYRNKLSSEKTKNNSNNNTAQSLSSAPSGKSIENFYDKPITDEKIALDSIEVNRDKLGYSDKNFTFIYDEKSSSGTAYHFDLYYKDIPVYSPVGIRGVSVITYYDNSADVLITGVSDSGKITKINTIPKITEDEALNIAKEILGANFSEYNIGANFEKVKVKPKLIIYKYNDEYSLAYYIQSCFYMCVINAESGDIITAHSTLVSKSAEYEGQRKGDIQQIFYDDVPLDDSSKKKNALYCKEKNIFIYDDLKKGKFDFEKLLTLNDIDSGKNKSAVDAMANTYKAIKYFEKFGISFDAVHIQVNDTDELENQFPKQTQACARIEQQKDGSITLAILNFGTKDMSGRQYSAYLDIVAHEYTHCVTNLKAFGSKGYKEDSIYFERNALMEAYSDVFGELIEQKCIGDTDWKVGDTSLIEPTFGSEYRYKYSKKRKTKDDKGTKKNDYGYAHDNSTIISHTAYLMNKDNDSKKYDAEFLLDYNQLAQLWYGSLEYLKETEFMDFSDCRYAVEKSARKLIKEGVLLEDNLKVIEQAFNEVEVSSNPARRGAMDSAEIKENHTLVVSIEDETQSSEPVEIKELNYTWHLDPTIEAEDIIVIDNKENFLENGYIYPYDECALIKQNGKYGIIKYDGTNIAEPVYEFGSYREGNEIGVWNQYNESEGIQCVDVFLVDGKLKISKNQVTGRGFVGSKYLWIDNKVTNMSDSLIFSGKYYDDDYNVVVQSAQLDSDKRFVNISNKYGIANKNSVLVPIEYDKGYMHSYNNIIALCKGEKWTYFNENGKSIIENCDGFKSNSNVVDLWQGGDYQLSENYILPYLPTENYIPVKINGQCGYYNTQGNEVIPCGTFEEVRPVHNGLAWVKKDGKWGVIKLKEIKTETNLNNNTSFKGEPWQQLYANELKKYMASDMYNDKSMFDLYDIDDDGIPELFISDSDLYHFAECKVYSVNNGIINDLISFHGTVNFLKNEKLLYDACNQGHSYINLYKKEKNKVELIFSAYTAKDGQFVGEFLGEEDAEYVVNGKTTNKMEYESELAKYCDLSNSDNIQWGLGRKYKLDEATVNSILLNIETPKTTLFTGTVNTEKDPLNVRKSPSANAEIIGQIEKGSTVTVYSESDDWYEIEYNGGVGYVSKKYIKSKGNNSDTQTSNISDNEILKAVNKYLEENQSNLGVWLSDSEPYCPAEHMHSSSTNWSCPINLNWESYSANEITGAYPHFAYVDKETLKCTLTANYETVVEFDLKGYLN